MLWVVESFEPKARQLFTLKVKAKDPAQLKPQLERLLTRHHVEFELRTESQEELHLRGAHADRAEDRSAVERDPRARSRECDARWSWEEKKEKK